LIVVTALNDVFAYGDFISRIRHTAPPHTETFDTFQIKENHIAACGGIAQAISAAHQIAPGKPVEVEVESLEELREALEAGADIVMLDELSLEDMREAVRLTAGRAKPEASGGINDSTLRVIAETGVDYISLGTLTKDVKAVDLSMRLAL
jgi:nicotinate-nucleotide pyrophosphorylase (carboxylating)